MWLMHCRERKDRLSKAKRLANTISKSNLGIEARQVSCDPVRVAGDP